MAEKAKFSPFWFLFLIAVVLLVIEFKRAERAKWEAEWNASMEAAKSVHHR